MPGKHSAISFLVKLDEGTFLCRLAYVVCGYGMVEDMHRSATGLSGSLLCFIHA